MKILSIPCPCLRLAWGIIWGLIAFGCTSPAGAPDAASPDRAQRPGYQFQVTDSFEVPVQGELAVHDYLPQQGLYVATLRPEQMVLLFDAQGDISRRIAPSAEQPGAWPDDIKGLVALGDTAIALLGTRAYHLYRLDGRYLRSYPHRPAPPVNVSPHRQVEVMVVQDTPHLLANFIHFAEAPAIAREFYETTRNVTGTNLVTGAYRWWMPFDANGVYRSAEDSYVVGSYACLFDHVPGTPSVWGVFSEGKRLYLYDAKDLSAPQAWFPTHAEHMRPRMRRPFGQYAASDLAEASKLVRLYSEYLGLWAKQDTVLLQYDTGLKDADQNDTLSEDLWLNQRHRLSDRYLQLFVAGEKICGDILLPPTVKRLYTFEGRRRLLFQAEPNALATEPRGIRLFVGALVAQ